MQSFLAAPCPCGRSSLGRLCAIAIVLVTLRFDSTTVHGDQSETATDPAATAPAVDHQWGPVLTLAQARAAFEADADTQYQALARISPRQLDAAQRAELIQLVAGLLKSEYPDIRGRAAETLALFGSETLTVIDALLPLLSDKEPQVNLEAVWVPTSKAISAIGAAALPAVLTKLEDCDRVTYYGITASIAGMGHAAASTAPRFVQLLETGPENRRWATIYTLEQLGPASVDAIPHLIENLGHSNFNMRVISCRALAIHGAKAKAAVPKLLELTSDKIISPRTHAVMCLASIGTKAVAAASPETDLVQLCLKMASEPIAFCQERGMIALGTLGEAARDAEPDILKLLKRDDFSQRPEAALALWRITGNSQQTLGMLEKLVEDPTNDLRVYEALKVMGPAAAPMADRLADQLSSPDQSLRVLMLDILAVMGSAAKHVVPKVKACLADGSREVQLAVDRTLLALTK